MSDENLLNDLKNWVALTQATIEEVRKDEEDIANRLGKIDERLGNIEKWLPVTDEKLKNFESFQHQIYKVVWAIALAVLVPIIGFFVRVPSIIDNNNHNNGNVRK